MKSWKSTASHCEKAYGVQVDQKDEFFICPDCGEPIYRCDYDAPDFWNDIDVSPYSECPICGFNWWEE